MFYTTVASPTQTDWKIWATQTSSDSKPFAPSASIKFTDVILGSDTYYFAFSVSNEFGSSELSTTSSAFSWSTIATSTFIASFQPGAITVARTGGTPSFTGISPQLYGTTSAGPVNFVTSQTDSDAAFVANTWRIGGSSTTGNADISTSGGLTLGSITDGGTYAQWGTPTAMSSSPAELAVPVRYKDPSGNVTQFGASKLAFTFVDNGDPGANGTRTARLQLYQWASSTPTSFPSGTSTYTWSTGAFTNPTLNGWTQAPGSGSPGQTLYSCVQEYADTGTSATSTVTWSTSTAFIVGYAGTNGTNGTDGVDATQSATVIVWQWALSIPSGPSGTSTYTWSTGSFSAPSGWSLTPGTSPTSGFTLWGATVYLNTLATNATSTINWTSASIVSYGYSGTNGTNGTDGTDGTDGVDGNSFRICYTSTDLTSLSSTPSTITTAGASSYPAAGSWGATIGGVNQSWVATPPTLTAGQSLYQSDGVYSPATGDTIWTVPYLSSLKVGSLSAITTNTGALNVTGKFKSNTAEVSGSTMTGSGGVIESNGNFAFGNSTTNVSFNGTTMTLNGNVVATSNINANAVTEIFSDYLGNLNNFALTTTLSTMVDVSVTNYTDFMPVIVNISGLAEVINQDGLTVGFYIEHVIERFTTAATTLLTWETHHLCDVIDLNDVKFTVPVAATIEDSFGVTGAPITVVYRYRARYVVSSGWNGNAQVKSPVIVATKFKR